MVFGLVFACLYRFLFAVYYISRVDAVNSTSVSSKLGSLQRDMILAHHSRQTQPQRKAGQEEKTKVFWQKTSPAESVEIRRACSSPNL